MLTYLPFERAKRRAYLTSAALLAGALCACTDGDKASRALSAAGYHNVQIIGWRAFGCDENDTFHTGFRATGADGQPVTGVVCSGILKNATVRTD